MVLGIFGSIFRYIRALGYFLTGNIDSARKLLSSNQYVIRATFDNIIEGKKKTVLEIQQAVSGLTTQEEKKIRRLKELTEEATRLEKLRTASVGKAKELASRLQLSGQTPEQVKANPDYSKYLSGYQDYSSTLEKVNKNIEDLENDIKEYQSSNARYKNQLIAIKREIDELKSEQEATVAEVVSSKEEKALNDLINGISSDTSSRELEEMREIRSRARSEAKVSRELAGTDNKAVEQELLDYAAKNSANSEFDDLIGLSPKIDKTESVKLPEA